jgi:hypothetical protein
MKGKKIRLINIYFGTIKYIYNFNNTLFELDVSY